MTSEPNPTTPFRPFLLLPLHQSRRRLCRDGLDFRTQETAKEKAGRAKLVLCPAEQYFDDLRMVPGECIVEQGSKRLDNGNCIDPQPESVLSAVCRHQGIRSSSFRAALVRLVGQELLKVCELLRVGRALDRPHGDFLHLRIRLLGLLS